MNGEESCNQLILFSLVCFVKIVKRITKLSVQGLGLSVEHPRDNTAQSEVQVLLRLDLKLQKANHSRRRTRVTGVDIVCILKGYRVTIRASWGRLFVIHHPIFQHKLKSTYQEQDQVFIIIFQNGKIKYQRRLWKLLPAWKRAW